MDKKRGFTLLEMAIVIVIIGFIIGTVIVGRDMLRNAQVQSLIADVNYFKSAAQQFREKYGFLPGDLPTATTYWGADTGCPIGDTGSNLARVVTCDGDGDSKIRDLTGTLTSVGVLSGKNQEPLRVWQHLANAGFIPGLYSGVAYSGNYRVGINIPASKTWPAYGFLMFYASPIDSTFKNTSGGSDTTAYPGTYGHVIEFGNPNSLATTSAFNGSFTLNPATMYSLDEKIDDGKPATGNVLAFTGVASGNPKCINGAAYNIAQTSVYCTPIFITGF
jgi:prepilin-type N-terminal cleavage/methylation domain-containing protein